MAHQWELDRGNNLVKLLPNGNLLALVGGRPLPVRRELGPPYKPEEVWSNFLMEAQWYPPDYPGLPHLDATPGRPRQQSARPPSAASEPPR